MSMFPTQNPFATGPGVGPSYGAILVAAPPDEVLAAAQEARFTGWLTPPAGEWVVLAPENPLGHAAGERRTAHDLAEHLAATLATRAICAVVRREELLTLTAYDGETQVLDYLSDAQVARPGDEFAWGPEGVHGAEALTRLCLGEAETVAVPRGKSSADRVRDVLAEESGEDENESERLMALARLLGWPEWLVALPGLPKRIASGPADLVRLRSGATGLAGRLKDRGARMKRRTDLTQG